MSGHENASGRPRSAKTQVRQIALPSTQIMTGCRSLSPQNEQRVGVMKLRYHRGRSGKIRTPEKAALSASCASPTVRRPRCPHPHSGPAEPPWKQSRLAAAAACGGDSSAADERVGSSSGPPASGTVRARGPAVRSMPSLAPNADHQRARRSGSVGWAELRGWRPVFRRRCGTDRGPWRPLGSDTSGGFASSPQASSGSCCGSCWVSLRRTTSLWK